MHSAWYRALSLLGCLAAIMLGLGHVGAQPPAGRTAVAQLDERRAQDKDLTPAAARLYLPWVGQRWPQEPPLPTPSATPTPTAVATPTPPCANGVTLTGVVYDAALGPTQAISGAAVWVVVCVPRSFGTTSGADGRYALYVPGAYLAGCPQVTFEASAPGYATASQVLGSETLCLQPQRDVALLPLPTPSATGTPSASPTATPGVAPSPTPTPTHTTTPTDTPSPTSAPTVTATESTAPSTTPTAGSGGTVYITATGAKYHRVDCRYVRTGATPVTCSWATSHGYTACSVCHPDCP